MGNYSSSSATPVPAPVVVVLDPLDTCSVCRAAPTRGPMLFRKHRVCDECAMWFWNWSRFTVGQVVTFLQRIGAAKDPDRIDLVIGIINTRRKQYMNIRKTKQYGISKRIRAAAPLPRTRIYESLEIAAASAN